MLKLLASLPPVGNVHTDGVRCILPAPRRCNRPHHRFRDLLGGRAAFDSTGKNKERNNKLLSL